MSEKIDRLCDQLRIKLHGIDRRLEALKGNNSATSEKSRHLVESQMDSVQQRIFERRHRVEAANASVAEWIEKRAVFDDQDASWKESADLSRLEARADDVEGYATGVFELAVGRQMRQPKQPWRLCWHAMMLNLPPSGRAEPRAEYHLPL